MYEKIKIENFRGINNLELNNLQQFSLFVGKNNCGKTSLLESIFIISNPADPFSTVGVNNIRGHYITQPYSWTVLFNKMEIEFPIRLTGEILKPKREKFAWHLLLSSHRATETTEDTESHMKYGTLHPRKDFPNF